MVLDATNWLSACASIWAIPSWLSRRASSARELCRNLRQFLCSSRYVPTGKLLLTSAERGPLLDAPRSPWHVPAELLDLHLRGAHIKAKFCRGTWRSRDVE